jgi:hypothetical protein
MIVNLRYIWFWPTLYILQPYSLCAPPSSSPSSVSALLLFFGGQRACANVSARTCIKCCWCVCVAGVNMSCACARVCEQKAWTSGHDPIFFIIFCQQINPSAENEALSDPYVCSWTCLCIHQDTGPSDSLY